MAERLWWLKLRCGRDRHGDFRQPRTDFVELVDHPDQRADMLLGPLKELLVSLRVVTAETPPAMLAQRPRACADRAIRSARSAGGGAAVRWPSRRGASDHFRRH